MTTTANLTALPFELDTISQQDAFKRLAAMEGDDASWDAGRMMDELAGIIGRLPDDKGQFRAVWILDDVVIKVPVTQSGYRALAGAAANAYEVREAKAGGYEHPRTGERFPIAACDVHWHSTGMPIVVMARIDTNPDDRFLPDWSRLVDKEQVGWNERTQGFEIYDAGCAPGTSEAQWDAIGIED